MKKTYVYGTVPGYAILSGAIIIGVLLVTSLKAYLTESDRIQRSVELSSMADVIGERMSNALITRLNAGEYLKTAYELNPELTQDEFAKIAEKLMHFHPSLRALQLADTDTQVMYVYPAKGNEITIREPMILIKDPLRGKYVKKAIDERRTTIQPPFKLRRGCFGIVARSPVFFGEDFGGLVITVLDVPVIIDEVMSDVDSARFVLSLIDSEGGTFWNPQPETEGAEVRGIPFSDTRWTMVLSWNDDYRSAMAREGSLVLHLAGAFLCVIALLLWTLINRAALMKREVEKRTRELAASEKRFREIVEDSDAGYFLIGVDGCFIDVNRSWLRLHRYESKAEIIGKSYTFTQVPEDMEQAFSMVKRLIGGEKVTCEEFSRRNNDGSIGYHSFTARPVFQDGNIIGLEGFLFDITARKKAEDAKDFLMKELNHRVKNNLMMISTLISLKDPDRGNPELSDIKSQIDAIRIVHEKLHHVEDITQLDIHDYIDDLLGTIFTAFTRHPVKVMNKISHITLGTKASISVGLIINELASNAIKHGFRPDDDAGFTVEMTVDGSAGEYILKVSNTGNSFPDHVSMANPDTLGLRLVSLLTMQLEGTVELIKRPITLFVFRFSSESS